MYVALTRAKKALFITRARERYSFGTYSANPRSRFLKEIPEHLLESKRNEPEFRFTSFNSSSFANFASSVKPQVRSIKEHVAGEFSLGNRVRHPQFGEGTIVSLRDDNIAEIAFGGLYKGIKKLNIKIAPLEKIS